MIGGPLTRWMLRCIQHYFSRSYCLRTWAWSEVFVRAIVMGLMAEQWHPFDVMFLEAPAATSLWFFWWAGKPHVHLAKGWSAPTRFPLHRWPFSEAVTNRLLDSLPFKIVTLSKWRRYYPRCTVGQPKFFFGKLGQTPRPTFGQIVAGHQFSATSDIVWPRLWSS